MLRLRIVVGERASVVVRLRPDPTPTTSALVSAVPFGSTASRWGDEVYFRAPFHAELESDSRQEMSVGEVAYWPDGDAIAVFFGRTPVSTGDAPMAYSPCNIVGAVDGDMSVLRKVASGTKVSVERV